MMNRPWSTYLIGIAFLLAFTACDGSRRLRKGKPLRPKSASSLLNKLEKTQVDFEWLGMKLEIDIEDKEKKRGFKSTVRVRKDSMIWMSITPLLGVEAAKVVITPDSIKYISKVPGNKHYFMGNIASLSEEFDIPFTYFMLQDLLIGNVVDMDQKDNFKSKVDEQQYVLVSEFTRKLKKVTGTDEKDLNPNDSLAVVLDSKKKNRIVRRADDNDLVFKRYWLNGETYQLEKTLIEDLLNKRTVEITHDDFDNYNEQWIPETTRLKVTDKGAVTEVEIEINRLKMNKVYDMPFEIPEEYERKYY